MPTLMLAGYKWQMGWYLQCAWQVAFVQQSQAGMIIGVICILAALATFTGTPIGA
jgi:hypothetical protein